MICAPCSLASSRSLAASCLASASCSRYWSSSCLASACASSDRARPPSIISVRCASVCCALGSRNLASAPNTRRKRIVPIMNSGHEGSSGFVDAVSAARGIIMRSLPEPGSVLEDERRHEADQRERLGQREADPHVQRDAAGGLRLAGHRLDRVAEDQADADAGADGGETVSDGAGVEPDGGAGRSENRHLSVLYVSYRRLVPPDGS